MAWTTFHYIWRSVPVYRSEEQGSLEEDLPPPLPDDVPRDEIQQPSSGHGPLLHRVYSCQVADTTLTPEGLIERLSADPNRVAPWQLARFRKTRGDEGKMALGDEFLVHMPGPWDGPVR